MPRRSFRPFLLQLNILLAVLLAAGNTEVMAQSPTLVRQDRWECAVGGGFLVPHRQAIRALVEGHARMLHIHWSTRAGGLWSCSREDARWGGTFRMGSTGSPRFLGTQLTLLGTADLRAAGAWRVRLGGGLGWTEKTWGTESQDARQRVVIGSPINAAIQIGLHRPASLEPRAAWHRRVGLHCTLDHQSNGSFTQPNLGTNVAALAVSMAIERQVQRPIREADTLVVLAILPKPVSGLRAHLAVGRRQPAPLGTRESVAEAGLDWRFGGGLRLGGILGSLALFRPSASGIGVHSGFQLRFTRVHIDLVHGRYLRRWQEEEGHYNRVVFHAHWRGGWWFNLGLLTHGFRAHHPAIGVGFVPGGRTPYGQTGISRRTPRTKRGSRGGR